MTNLVDVFRKTIEIGDEVYTTQSSNGTRWNTHATIYSFAEDGKGVYIKKDVKKSSFLYRDPKKIMVITQQLQHNRTEYPENQI